MNSRCAKCNKIVYPVEKLVCLDQVWHKLCFRCEVCNMLLNMNNYKGYNKRPYCSAHYPTTKFTTVTDTPENLRLAQQQKNQSNNHYWKERKTTLQKFTTVVDTPENIRLAQQQKNQSEAVYRKDKVNAFKEFTVVADSVATKTAINSANLASQVKYQTAPHEVGREGKPIGEIVNRIKKVDINDEDEKQDNEAPASNESSKQNSNENAQLADEVKMEEKEKAFEEEVEEKARAVEENGDDHVLEDQDIADEDEVSDEV